MPDSRFILLKLTLTLCPLSVDTYHLETMPLNAYVGWCTEHCTDSPPKCMLGCRHRFYDSLFQPQLKPAHFASPQFFGGTSSIRSDTDPSTSSGFSWENFEYHFVRALSEQLLSYALFAAELCELSDGGRLRITDPDIILKILEHIEAQPPPFKTATVIHS